ncbi:hypothetical protein Tsubulata_044079, partial [Turnera subulata]
RKCWWLRSRSRWPSPLSFLSSSSSAPVLLRLLLVVSRPGTVVQRPVDRAGSGSAAAASISASSAFCLALNTLQSITINKGTRELPMEAKPENENEILKIPKSLACNLKFALGAPAAAVAHSRGSRETIRDGVGFLLLFCFLGKRRDTKQMRWGFGMDIICFFFFVMAVIHLL